LADPATSKKIPGANFLHATLETRSDMIQNSPQKVEKMTRILVKSLQWITSHKPEEVVAQLKVTDPEEISSLLLALRKYPHAYSHNGKFSSNQLKQTELFFRQTNSDNARAQSLNIENIINDKWAGRIQ
jgi:ABC-type nitrate/sulfonate/bicarbonate transport system substrate-binding protein